MDIISILCVKVAILLILTKLLRHWNQENFAEFESFERSDELENAWKVQILYIENKLSCVIVPDPNSSYLQQIKTFPGKTHHHSSVYTTELDTIIISHKNIFYSRARTRKNQYKQSKNKHLIAQRCRAKGGEGKISTEREG